MNHQLADCGQFEFYRNQEWLTKEASGYAMDSAWINGSTCKYHQNLCVKNTCNDPTISAPPNMHPDEQGYFAVGSQNVCVCARLQERVFFARLMYISRPAKQPSANLV